MRAISFFLSGALFGLGLLVAGMTDPNRILRFLDIGGDFDPALVLVLASAVLVHRTLLWLFRARRTPVMAAAFSLPPSDAIDRRLIIGSAIFGVGWGLVGYCPGPALVGLAAGRGDAVLFALSMAIAMFLFAVRHKVTLRLPSSRQSAS